MTAKKKVTSAITGLQVPENYIQAAQASAIPAQLISQPMVLEPYEYQVVTPSQRTIRRSYVMDSGVLVNGADSTLDQTFSGNTINVDSILMSANLYATVFGTMDAGSSVGIRIYQSDGSTLVYELRTGFSSNNTGVPIVDNPRIILYAGDIVKLGRDINVAAGEIRARICLNLQPFR